MKHKTAKPKVELSVSSWYFQKKLADSNAFANRVGCDCDFDFEHSRRLSTSQLFACKFTPGVQWRPLTRSLASNLLILVDGGWGVYAFECRDLQRTQGHHTIFKLAHFLRMCYIVIFTIIAYIYNLFITV
jgi:hypothetical protein